MASPQGTTNVAWLQLANVAGTLATSVYRVDTLLGQPPATCNPATDTKVLAVAYTAKYCERLCIICWFLNLSLSFFRVLLSRN